MATPVPRVPSKPLKRNAYRIITVSQALVNLAPPVSMGPHLDLLRLMNARTAHLVTCAQLSILVRLTAQLVITVPVASLKRCKSTVHVPLDKYAQLHALRVPIVAQEVGPSLSVLQVSSRTNWDKVNASHALLVITALIAALKHHSLALLVNTALPPQSFQPSARSVNTLIQPLPAPRAQLVSIAGPTK